MVKLHQAKLSDTFEVLHVLNTALDKKLAYGDSAWGSDKFTSTEILPFIESGELYIVIEQGDVIGVVVLQESDENMWDKDGSDNTALYIHKLASLQKGLGTKMINAAEILAKKNGKSSLRLDCSFENEGLYKYYIDNGFHEVRLQIIDDIKIAFLQKELV